MYPVNMYLVIAVIFLCALCIAMQMTSIKSVHGILFEAGDDGIFDNNRFEIARKAINMGYYVSTMITIMAVTMLVCLRS